jgi:hypothetical protein
MGQPICDFHRRDPQSSLYINSGFSAGMRKMRTFRDGGAMYQIDHRSLGAKASGSKLENSQRSWR